MDNQIKVFLVMELYGSFDEQYFEVIAVFEEEKDADIFSEKINKELNTYSSVHESTYYPKGVIPNV